MNDKELLKKFIVRILISVFILIIVLNVLIQLEYKSQYSSLIKKNEIDEKLLNQRYSKIIEEALYDILVLKNDYQIIDYKNKKQLIEKKLKRFLDIKSYYRRIKIYNENYNEVIGVNNYKSNMKFEDDVDLNEKSDKSIINIYPIRCNCYDEIVIGIDAPIYKKDKYIGNIVLEVSLNRLINDFSEKYINYINNKDLSVFILGENEILYEVKNNLTQSQFNDLNIMNLKENKDVLNFDEIFYDFFVVESKINKNLLNKIYYETNNNKKYYINKSDINILIFLSKEYFVKLRKKAFMSFIIKNWFFIIIFLIISLISSYIYSKNIIYKEKIEKNASFDSLTNLYNRHIAMEFLEKYIKSYNRNLENLTIIFLDANNLKKINDTFGHKKGDEMLITISKAIKKSIRESDIASRIGGDEFLIILPNCDSKKANKIKKRINKYLDKFNNENLLKCKYSASMGIEEYEKGTKLEEFVSNADKKMYEDKENNK